MANQKGGYYLPEPSHWPLVGSTGLFFFLMGAAQWLHGHDIGPYVFAGGALILIYMMYGWFGVVVRENRAGLYNQQVDVSYRWAMAWFIFTEVMFFATFFGALLYVRVLSVPWIGGTGHGVSTHLLLWSHFKAHWPLLVNPSQSLFPGPHAVMNTWGLPALNTLILLSSGATLTWAHWALVKDKRKQLIIGMTLTVLLGIIFLCCQGIEYGEAYRHHGLTLASGIYGATFFMLTGFHGLHVTIGTTMLIVILFRCMKGHFSADNQFAFEAVSWYWHFVDVVWLFLFIFVYWL